MLSIADDSSMNRIMDERDLAEHGREHLLEKADVWEQNRRENPMPLPPWFVPSRMNTVIRWESDRGSRASHTSTATPAIYENEQQRLAQSRPEVHSNITPEPVRNESPNAKDWALSLSGKERRDGDSKPPNMQKSDSKPNLDKIIIDADQKDVDMDEPATPLPGQQLVEKEEPEVNEGQDPFNVPDDVSATFSMPPSRKATPLF